MKRAVTTLLGLCVILLFAVAGVTGTGALLSVKDTGGGGARSGATRVSVAAPETRRIEDVVTATGTIMPGRMVTLVPDAPGRVTSVPVASGQTVAEGDLLIQLEDRAAQAALSQAKATLAEARQDYRRVTRLAESNAAAQAQVEGARADRLRAEAAVMTARADLQDRALRAPFAGTLGVIDITRGTYLDDTSPVTRLSDLSTVKVSATLPEQHFDRVRPGQTLLVSTPAYPGTTFEARVTVRAPEIDRATRSFEIRARIDNPDRRLAGGMFARSRLLIGRHDGIAIPDAAIISEGLTSHVYTVAGDTATRTEVEPGRSLGAATEIRAGLSADDRVVVAGWDQLSDGAAVTVTGDDDTQDAPR